MAVTLWQNEFHSNSIATIGIFAITLSEIARWVLKHYRRDHTRSVPSAYRDRWFATKNLLRILPRGAAKQLRSDQTVDRWRGVSTLCRAEFDLKIGELG